MIMLSNVQCNSDKFRINANIKSGVENVIKASLIHQTNHNISMPYHMHAFNADWLFVNAQCHFVFLLHISTKKLNNVNKTRKQKPFNNIL